jgi:hypothetical protein
MTEESERLQILEMIEGGIISATQEASGASAMPETAPSTNTTYEEPGPETARPAPDLDSHVRKWSRWYWIPMWIGVGITVVSGALMYLAFDRGGFSFLFACTWFPFLLGVAVMALAWASRTARWIHVRVQQKEDDWPRNIAISLPLPIRLTAWFVRIFSPHIPKLNGASLDELILVLEKTSPAAPLFVQVDEGKDGERVEVYIG